MSAVLYLGLLIDRFGPERALVALPYFALLAVMFFAGTTMIGSRTGANGACAALYPARMRTTGIGWSIGIGRLGIIASPDIGRLSAGARLAADADLVERVFLCGGGDGPARTARESRYAARAAAARAPSR